LVTLWDAALSIARERTPALVSRLRSVISASGTLQGLRLALKDTLQGAGHQVAHLDGAQLGQALAWSVLPDEQPLPVILPDLPLREQLLTQEMWSTSGGWAFPTGSAPVMAQVLSLHRAPPQTYPGILCAPRAPKDTHPLALWEAWEGPLRVVVNVAVVDQAKELAGLRTKRTMAFLQRFNPLGDTSPEHAALKEELDQLLRTFFLGGGQLAWGRIHIVLWGTPDALPRGMDDVIRRGRRLNLEFVPELTLGSTLFLQTLPLGFDPTWPAERFVRRSRRLPGGNLADLLPLYGGLQGTLTPSMLYLNQRGEAVTFDPFDSATNPHMIVTGMPGAGKSFAMAYLDQQVLPLGASVVILDRLPSYEHLCAAWHGRYLAMDFNAPICFNPFYGPLDKTHVAFLTASLAEMASGGVEPLNRETRGVLADAVAYFAQQWDLRRGEPHLSPFVEEVLREGSFSPKDRRARQLGAELARKLGMFYGRGPYAGFIDGPNTLVLDNALTVIELSKLQEHDDLQGILLFALMHLLTQFFTAPDRLHQAKYLVADEVWALLRLPSTASVMEEIGRTYRKLRTSAIFLSQEPGDFESATGAVLRGLAGAKLFLQQDPSELAKIQEIFKLTLEEMQLLSHVRKHSGWSSAYLQLPGKTGGMIRLVPDRLTQWLVGQDPQTRREREAALVAHGGDIHAAIASLGTTLYG
jgi:hypothetical protein